MAISAAIAATMGDVNRGGVEQLLAMAGVRTYAVVSSFMSVSWIVFRGVVDSGYRQDECLWMTTGVPPPFRAPDLYAYPGDVHAPQSEMPSWSWDGLVYGGRPRMIEPSPAAYHWFNETSCAASAGEGGGGDGGAGAGGGAGPGGVGPGGARRDDDGARFVSILKAVRGVNARLDCQQQGGGRWGPGCALRRAAPFANHTPPPSLPPPSSPLPPPPPPALSCTMTRTPAPRRTCCPTSR